MIGTYPDCHKWFRRPYQARRKRKIGWDISMVGLIFELTLSNRVKVAAKQIPTIPSFPGLWRKSIYLYN